MTIEVYVEHEGIRLTALLVTSDLPTHSALQEVSKELIEEVKFGIRQQLIKLADITAEHRKAP